MLSDLFCMEKHQWNMQRRVKMTLPAVARRRAGARGRRRAAGGRDEHAACGAGRLPGLRDRPRQHDEQVTPAMTASLVPPSSPRAALLKVNSSTNSYNPTPEPGVPPTFRGDRKCPLSWLGSRMGSAVGGGRLRLPGGSAQLLTYTLAADWVRPPPAQRRPADRRSPVRPVRPGPQRSLNLKDHEPSRTLLPRGLLKGVRTARAGLAAPRASWGAGRGGGPPSSGRAAPAQEGLASGAAPCSSAREHRDHDGNRWQQLPVMTRSRHAPHSPTASPTRLMDSARQLLLF
jgi:hypothetical protein